MWKWDWKYTQFYVSKTLLAFFPLCLLFHIIKSQADVVTYIGSRRQKFFEGKKLLIYEVSFLWNTFLRFPCCGNFQVYMLENNLGNLPQSCDSISNYGVDSWIKVWNFKFLWGKILERISYYRTTPSHRSMKFLQILN